MSKLKFTEQEKKEFGKYRICVAKKSHFYRKKLNKLHRKLKAAFSKKFLWPAESTIKINFLKEPPSNLERQNAEQIKQGAPDLELDPLQEEVDKIDNIIDAIKLIIKKRIEPIVNLKFEYVESRSLADIRVDFNPDDGAWSYVGTDCRNPEYSKDESTLNLGWFDVSTTIHEFCHALGMIHEHQNPRGNKIKWNRDAVFEWAESSQGWDKETTKTNILDMPNEQINGSEFDPLSIMLYFYPENLTLDDDGKCCGEKKIKEDGECCGKGTHQNLRMSALDVIWLNKMYPGSKVTPKKFYKEAYGEDIDKEISLSAKQNAQDVIGYSQPENSSKPGSKIGIYIGIVFLIIIIIVILYAF